MYTRHTPVNIHLKSVILYYKGRLNQVKTILPSVHGSKQGRSQKSATDFHVKMLKRHCNKRANSKV